MKKTDLIFTVLQLPLDLISLFLAFILAYLIRFNLELPAYTNLWPFSDYFKFFPYFLPVWVIIFALEGLYNIRRAKRGLKEFSSIFLGVSAGIMVMVVVLFLTRFFLFSRLVILYAWVLAIILVALDRFLLKTFQRYLYKKGIGLHRAIIVGTQDLGRGIAKEIEKNPSLGFKLVKLVDRNGIDKLDRIFTKNKFEEIILADPTLSEKEAGKVLAFCEDKKLTFKMVPNIFRVKTANVEIGAFSTYPILEFKRTPLEGWGKVIKRSFDIIISFISLLILLPLFLIIALLIKLDSKGPVFFKHKRMGSEGKIFNLYKFRSMIEEAPNLYKKLAKKKGLFFAKIENDPRITKLGRFLRATCIDELPQLINVLKGELSLVGPRPLTPEEFKQVSNYERKYSWTSYIKPGITGLWQVSGYRTELSDQERLSLDIYYVENWSPLLDLWIILKTPLAILKDRKVV
jgi:exopolysaccharide biosynthesis polyprenyl glycosylphosphotransferase